MLCKQHVVYANMVNIPQIKKKTNHFFSFDKAIFFEGEKKTPDTRIKKEETTPASGGNTGGLFLGF